jgi:hypothetical protein
VPLSILVPKVERLPVIIILFVLTPFRALIILKICCEVIIPPGVIPAVDIVLGGGSNTTDEAIAGDSDPESVLT